MTEQETTSRTFRNELLRAIPAGVLETLSSTFGVLIAVRVFDASKMAKSVFLSATSAGLMLSLFVVPLLLRSRYTVASTAARVQFMGAVAFAMTALFPASEILFTLGSSVGLFFFALQIPLQTQIYRLNYPEKIRGKLFSLTATMRALAAMLFGLAGGHLLGWKLDAYPWLLWAFSLAALVSGLWTMRLPTPTWNAPEAAQDSVWSSLRWVRSDKDFRTLLISWMMMGIGNLVACSLFVEYLANPRHGHTLETQTIAWITGVVPVLFRIAFTYPWGLLYDRVNFYVVRVSLNVLFAVSILCFFVGNNLAWWCVSMAIFGIANAGGNVTWSLWVTKLAPRHAVAEYMSVHTFFTGLRGLVAPFLAFWLIDVMSFQAVGIACAVFIFAACGFITFRAQKRDTTTSHRLVPGSAPIEEEWTERL
jgi:MFS family permease